MFEYLSTCIFAPYLWASLPPFSPFPSLFLFSPPYLHTHTQVQADLIKEAIDYMSDATPPLFDPLGEGVDVSDLDASAGGSAASVSTTMKTGYKAKVSEKKNIRD